jgi:hypothetical protein
MLCVLQKELFSYTFHRSHIVYLHLYIRFKYDVDVIYYLLIKYNWYLVIPLFISPFSLFDSVWF